ncbi:MAG: hypothetical protein WKF67_07255 [Rubrobacteraceae bacterium]
MTGVALEAGKVFERPTIPHHHELPRLEIHRAAGPASYLEDVFDDSPGYGSRAEAAHGTQLSEKRDNGVCAS